VLAVAEQIAVNGVAGAVLVDPVARLLRSKGAKPHVLAMSKAGVPMHPLYLRDSLRPVLWPVQ